MQRQEEPIGVFTLPEETDDSRNQTVYVNPTHNDAQPTNTVSLSIPAESAPFIDPLNTHLEFDLNFKSKVTSNEYPYGAKIISSTHTGGHTNLKADGGLLCYENLDRDQLDHMANAYNFRFDKGGIKFPLKPGGKPDVKAMGFGSRSLLNAGLQYPTFVPVYPVHTDTGFFPQWHDEALGNNDHYPLSFYATQRQNTNHGNRFLRHCSRIQQLSCEPVHPTPMCAPPPHAGAKGIFNRVQLSTSDRTVLEEIQANHMLQEELSKVTATPDSLSNESVFTACSPHTNEHGLSKNYENHSNIAIYDDMKTIGKFEDFEILNLQPIIDAYGSTDIASVDSKNIYITRTYAQGADASQPRAPIAPFDTFPKISRSINQDVNETEAGEFMWANRMFHPTDDPQDPNVCLIYKPTGTIANNRLENPTRLLGYRSTYQAYLVTNREQRTHYPSRNNPDAGQPWQNVANWDWDNDLHHNGWPTISDVLQGGTWDRIPLGKCGCVSSNPIVSFLRVYFNDNVHEPQTKSITGQLAYEGDHEHPAYHPSTVNFIHQDLIGNSVEYKFSHCFSVKEDAELCSQMMNILDAKATHVFSNNFYDMTVKTTSDNGLILLPHQYQVTISSNEGDNILPDGVSAPAASLFNSDTVKFGTHSQEGHQLYDLQWDPSTHFLEDTFHIDHWAFMEKKETELYVDVIPSTTTLTPYTAELITSDAQHGTVSLNQSMSDGSNPAYKIDTTTIDFTQSINTIEHWMTLSTLTDTSEQILWKCMDSNGHYIQLSSMPDDTFKLELYNATTPETATTTVSKTTAAITSDDTWFYVRVTIKDTGECILTINDTTSSPVTLALSWGATNDLYLLGSDTSAVSGSLDLLRISASEPTQADVYQPDDNTILFLDFEYPDTPLWTIKDTVNDKSLFECRAVWLTQDTYTLSLLLPDGTILSDVTHPIDVDVWQHLAVEQYLNDVGATTLGLYNNGVLITSLVSTQDFTLGTNFQIGSSISVVNNTTSFYVDEYRFTTHDSTLYAGGSYQVPDDIYEASDHEIILLHYYETPKVFARATISSTSTQVYLVDHVTPEDRFELSLDKDENTFTLSSSEFGDFLVPLNDDVDYADLSHDRRDHVNHVFMDLDDAWSFPVYLIKDKYLIEDINEETQSPNEASHKININTIEDYNLGASIEDVRSIVQTISKPTALSNLTLNNFIGATADDIVHLFGQEWQLVLQPITSFEIDVTKRIQIPLPFGHFEQKNFIPNLEYGGLELDLDLCSQAQFLKPSADVILSNLNATSAIPYTVEERDFSIKDIRCAVRTLMISSEQQGVLRDKIMTNGSVNMEIMSWTNITQTIPSLTNRATIDLDRATHQAAFGCLSAIRYNSTETHSLLFPPDLIQRKAGEDDEIGYDFANNPVHGITKFQWQLFQKLSPNRPLEVQDATLRDKSLAIKLPRLVFQTKKFFDNINFKMRNASMSTTLPIATNFSVYNGTVNLMRSGLQLLLHFDRKPTDSFIIETWIPHIRSIKINQGITDVQF